MASPPAPPSFGRWGAEDSGADTQFIQVHVCAERWYRAFQEPGSGPTSRLRRPGPGFFPRIQNPSHLIIFPPPRLLAAGARGGSSGTAKSGMSAGISGAWGHVSALPNITIRAGGYCICVPIWLPGKGPLKGDAKVAEISPLPYRFFTKSFIKGSNMRKGKAPGHETCMQLREGLAGEEGESGSLESRSPQSVVEK